MANARNTAKLTAYQTELVARALREVAESPNWYEESTRNNARELAKRFEEAQFCTLKESD